MVASRPPPRGWWASSSTARPRGGPPDHARASGPFPASPCACCRCSPARASRDCSPSASPPARPRAGAATTSCRATSARSPPTSTAPGKEPIAAISRPWGEQHRLSPYHRLLIYLERRIFQLRSARSHRGHLRRGKAEIERLYGTPARARDPDLQRRGPRRASRRTIARAGTGPAMRAELGVDAADWCVLFVGSGFERKGLGPLVEAAGLHRRPSRAPDRGRQGEPGPVSRPRRRGSGSATRHLDRAAPRRRPALRRRRSRRAPGALRALRQRAPRGPRLGRPRAVERARGRQPSSSGTASMAGWPREVSGPRVSPRGSSGCARPDATSPAAQARASAEPYTLCRPGRALRGPRIAETPLFIEPSPGEHYTFPRCRHRARRLHRPRRLSHRGGGVCQSRQPYPPPAAHGGRPSGRLNAAGVPAVMVTNQAGIARGYFSERRCCMPSTPRWCASSPRRARGSTGSTSAPITRQQGSRRIAWLRLPEAAPGLLPRAARELGLDLAGSVMVGDKTSDVGVGQAGGRGGACSSSPDTGAGSGSISGAQWTEQARPCRRGSARRRRLGAGAPARADVPAEARMLDARRAASRAARIVVVGDLIADEYLYGKPARISREAPVLILRFTEREVRLGGAANAAHNVRALGAHAVPVGRGGRRCGRRRRSLRALRPRRHLHRGAGAGGGARARR